MLHHEFRLIGLGDSREFCRVSDELRDDVFENAEISITFLRTGRIEPHVGIWDVSRA